MKEIYQITLSEFREDLMNGERDFKLLGNNWRYCSDLVLSLKYSIDNNNNVEEAYKLFNKATKDEHEACVLTAYVDKLDIPNNVTSDYAHLIK